MNLRLFGLIGCLFLATTLADCPDNYFYQPELNLCLSYSSFVLRTWQSAHAWCDALSGGELLSIHNVIVNSILVNLQQKSGDTLSWLGATRNDSQGQWTWSDGTKWDYERFPSSSGAGNCGALNAETQRWAYKDCNSLLPFFCSVPPTSPTSTAAVETTTAANTSICSTTPKPLNCSPPEQQPLYNCQQGWQCFGEYEYLVLFDTEANAAEAACTSQGGHLTSIHSDAENNFITNLCCPSDCKFFHNNRCGQMITGGRVANGGFIWTDGTPFDYQGTICDDYQESDEFLQVMAYTRNNDACGIPGRWLWLSITGDPYAVCKRKL